MDFSLAYIKSESQILLKEFPSTEFPKGKIIDREGLNDLNLQGLFYDNELLETGEWVEFLRNENKFFPMISADELPLTFAEFETIDDEIALQKITAAQKSWILRNNLSLLENIFKMTTHMKNLWPNDRTSFFEELWFLLRSNIGAKDLIIIFNDIKKGNKEGDKNKLVQTKIQGTKIPEPIAGGEIEAKLLKDYAKNFSPEFEIAEWDKTKGELIATVSIQNSPVLVMAKVFSLTPIQKSLLIGLFDGLQ